MLELSREELAWAAGFFDGEGCFSTNLIRGRVRDYHMPALSIRQKYPEVLARFREAVGTIGLVSHYPKANVPWEYRVSGWRQQQAVMAMLWLWLSPIKRAQARRVFGRWREDAQRPRYLLERCVRGHDLTVEANIYRYAGGPATPAKRGCRGCNRERQRERRARTA